MQRPEPGFKQRPLLWSLLLIALLAALLAQRSYGAPVDSLQPVGSTTLKVLFWTIYDSTLFTKDGNYTGIEPGLALKIEYRRNIRSERLVETTREQWQELSIYDPQLSEQWLDQLASIWPDIRRGDDITLLVEPDMAAAFYLNEEPLGTIASEEFTRRFLGIWLSEQSSYPEQRNELVGAR